jgi:hypothetical protein
MSDTAYDPNEGGVGYMTWDQYDRLTRAVNDAMKHVYWWRVCGHIRSGDHDEMRVRASEHPLPLPAPWLAADEITRLLGELNYWPELADAVNTLEGYEYAVELIREVGTAMARWPIEDRPHRVQFFRCLACQQLTLRYHPPTVIDGQLTDTIVRCTRKECRAVMDEDMWTHAALVIQQEWEARNGKQRVDPGSGSAGESEPFEADGLPVGSRGPGAIDPTVEGSVVVPA